MSLYGFVLNYTWLDTVRSNPRRAVYESAYPFTQPFGNILFEAIRPQSLIYWSFQLIKVDFSSYPQMILFALAYMAENVVT